MGGSKAQTIGYRFCLSLHAVFTRGPVDKFLRIEFDKRVAWFGEATGGSISVRNMNLFGGDEREGGVAGMVDVMLGEPDQLQNDHLGGLLGYEHLPAYRGVAGLVFRGGVELLPVFGPTLDQFYFGMNPYLKPVAARIQRIHKTTGGALQWYDEKAAIGDVYVPGAAGGYWSLTDRTNTASEGVTVTGAIAECWAGPLSTAAFVGARANKKRSTADGGRYYFEVEILRFSVGPWCGFKRNDQPLATNSILSSTGGIVGPGTGFQVGDTSSTHSLGIATGDVIGVGIDFTSKRVWYTLNGNELQNTLGAALSDWSDANGTFNKILEDGEYAPWVLFDSNAGAVESDGPSVRLRLTETELLYRNSAPGVYAQFEAWDGEAPIDPSTYADMNPAHIIRECVTDTDWGMGYSAGDVDEASFIAAADKLFAEDFGLSLLWDRQIIIEDFIKEIIKHIDAALYVDRKTGKFTLKLIRDDYDAATLLVLDESNIDKIDNFQRSAFGELTNSVTVNYWDSVTGNDASLTLQDDALVAMQGAVINTTLQYPGITNQPLAARVAQRDLITLSNPLISCVVYANRIAAGLTVGSVFKLTWPDYEIENLVMRVTAIAYGDGRNNRVRITCTQDIFSMPSVSFVQPTPPAWQDPNTDPEPSTIRLAMELPYLELVQREGQTAVDSALSDNPDLGYVGITGTRPNAGAINAIITSDSGAGYKEVGIVDFSPYCVLAADAGLIDTVLNLASMAETDVVELGTCVQFGDEIMAVVSIDETLSTVTVERGVMDTVPTAHSAGEIGLFWDAYLGVDRTEYVTSDSVDLKLLPRTGTGLLDAGSAPVDNVVVVGRAAKPYPPGNFKINTEYFPQYISGALALTWAHRDRTQQTSGELIGFTEASIGPESSVTYTVRVYGETGALIHTENGVSVANWTYATATEQTDAAIPGDTSAIVDGFSSNTLANYTSRGDALADWSISGGFLQASTGTQSVLTYNGYSVQDFRTEMIITEGPDAGMVGRYVDNNNYYVVALHDSGAAPTPNSIQLFKRVGGVYTQLGSTQAISFTRGTSHIVEFSAVGTALTVKFDDVTKFSLVDASITGAGLVGPRHNGGPTKIDEFKIYTGASGYRLNGKLRVELESVKLGRTSFTKYDWTVARYGYGFNYGETYGGI